MDLERIGAVFELIAHRDRLARKFSGLARGDEAGAELERDGDAHHEAAGLRADDLRDARVLERLGDGLDGAAHRLGIGEQRRDVLEYDARLGIIRNVDDTRCEVEVSHGSPLS